MDTALVSLLAASATLVATHFLLSHPLRAWIVRSFGEKGFLLLYSLVALGAIWWMTRAFQDAPPGGLSGTGTAGWIVASILTLFAVLLLAGSLWRNPAFPNPDGTPQLPARAHGVFNITRHPMMWGFALWAIAHIVVWWSWRTVIVAIAILLLALVGAALQDGKKRALHGPAWRAWEAKTSYWPRPRGITSVGWTIWLAGLLGWLAASWAHLPLGQIPAGIWLWL